jgi:hypothetical protein
MDASVYYVKILNFKLKMTDPNRSIYSPYQTLVEKQILYLKKIAILLSQEKNYLI